MLFSATTVGIDKRFGVVNTVKMMCEAGFTAIDVSLCKADGELYGPNYRELCKEMKKVADSYGVVFNQAHGLFNRDREFFEREYRPLVPRSFEVCALLGIPHIVFHPEKDPTTLFYTHEERNIERNLDYYRTYVPLCEEYGVKVAIENMFARHISEPSKLTDGQFASPVQHRDFYDKLNDSRHFTLCLDVGHTAITSRDPAESIRILGKERLGALHIQDVDFVTDQHTLPGLSKLDYDSICRALGEIDYQGDFTLETHHFYMGFEDDFMPSAIRFMAERAKYLADKVEGYRVVKA